MVEKKGLFNMLLDFSEPQQQTNPVPPSPEPFASQSASPTPVEIREVGNLVPRGKSGTLAYSGVFSEEYLRELTGNDAAEIYDKMRRQDAIVKMILSAVKNPIKGAAWDIDPADENDPMAVEHAEFVRHCIFDDMDKPWEEVLPEHLTMVDFGHALGEVVHKVVFDHPRWGTYTGLRQIGFRAQKTILRWNLNPDSGALEGVDQWVNGDVPSKIVIPGENLVVFSMDKEGDNYEGISALRACYGPWFRKQLYLKLMAIGIEKNAVPTPKMKYPQGSQDTEQFSKMLGILRAYTSHQQNYVAYPEGYELDFNQNTYDPNGTKEAVLFENGEMVMAFLANFLLLGQNGGSGSYALSFDLSDFFLGGLEHVGGLVCSPYNKRIIPQLVRMKYGPQAKYPKMAAKGISDKAGKEVAEIVKTLSEAKALIPDTPLEVHLRKRYGFPKLSLDGQRGATPPPPTVPGMPPLVPGQPVPPVEPQTPPIIDPTQPIEPLALAEKAKGPKALMRQAEDKIADVMKAGLEEISGTLIDDVLRAWKNLPESRKVNATTNVVCRGISAYRTALQEALIECAALSLTLARKDVPGVKPVKMSESSVTLSEFDRLPVRTQKKIIKQSALLVQTQMYDLQKAVFFQFSSSVDSTLGSEALLQKDLEESAAKYIGGPSVGTAAGNTAAFIVNEARNAFFFDEETLNSVESFTFVNGDPVSEICKDLAGRTFSANDPEAERYFPPLHHNCKSFLVPNLKGKSSKEVDSRGLKPSDPKLEKFITLADVRG